MTQLWTALISALAALSGVALTLWRQGSLEKARWNREKIKLDEERDREDRHRFADIKRDAYSRFPPVIENWFWDLVSAIRNVNSYNEQIGDGDGPSVSDLMHETSAAHGAKVRSVLAELALLAPSEVQKHADRCMKTLASWSRETSEQTGHQWPDTKITETIVVMTEFIQAARADLGVKGDEDSNYLWQTFGVSPGSIDIAEMLGKKPDVDI